jgi:hypothetical protein
MSFTSWAVKNVVLNQRQVRLVWPVDLICFTVFMMIELEQDIKINIK